MTFFCSVREIRMASEYNRDIKTRRQLLCFISKKTLFFDCDTEVNGDLTPMFDCLDRFDIKTAVGGRLSISTQLLAAKWTSPG
jgi:hypothetical protein